MTTGDVERLTPHMAGIVQYLPEAKREFLRREGGSFVGDPRRQSTDMRPQETVAMIRFFKSPEEMRCTWVLDDGCVFLYPSTEQAPGNGQAVPSSIAAIHSYALEQGMDWKAFKQTDCVQYPCARGQQDGLDGPARRKSRAGPACPASTTPSGRSCDRSLPGPSSTSWASPSTNGSRPTGTRISRSAIKAG